MIVSAMRLCILYGSQTHACSEQKEIEGNEETTSKEYDEKGLKWNILLLSLLEVYLLSEYMCVCASIGHSP